MNIILKKPVISEQSMKLAAQGFYTFLVKKAARKPEIIKSVEEQFGVSVTAIKTANYKPKRKSQKRVRGYFTVAGFKKAVVALKPWQKIGLFTPDEGKVEKAEGNRKVEVKEKKKLLAGTKVKIEKGGK